MSNPLDVFSDAMAIFGGPGRYVQGRGVVDLVGRCAAQLGPTALLVTDAVVLGLLEDRLRASFVAAGVELRILCFDGKLGPATAGQLAARVAPDWPVGAVVAAGGGRAIDAGKALAHRIGSSLITVPTAASTDAPTSKNYVLYDDEGMLAEVCHLPRNPDFVIVDTEVLARAPRAMFAAGLGDALSKGLEAEGCAAGKGVNMFLARPTRLGTAIARTCYTTLLDNAIAAFDQAGSGEVSAAFDSAVEAMILMAGLGFENGGLSVPHALTRGLPLLPGGAKAAHGLQVAYGLAVHHALLGQPMPEALACIYRHVGLPRSLRALTGHAVTEAQIRRVVAVTMPVRHMLNFPRALTEADLLSAMLAVEADADTGATA